MDELEYLYVLISDSVEDSIILDNAKDATILSFKNPCSKILIFRKNIETGLFKPIHRYYIGGKLI